MRIYFFKFNINCIHLNATNVTNVTNAIETHVLDDSVGPHRRGSVEAVEDRSDGGHGWRRGQAADGQPILNCILCILSM